MKPETNKNIMAILMAILSIELILLVLLLFAPQVDESIKSNPWESPVEYQPHNPLPIDWISIGIVFVVISVIAILIYLVPAPINPNKPLL